MIISSHITGQLHTMLEPHIQTGGVYIDATAGGGRDIANLLNFNMSCFNCF